MIEDVPGVGKTTFANVLAKSIDYKFTRIQFTPDTMPSDITGSSIYNYEQNKFEYFEGAIMSNIVLADEINRTSPKTQASLLEAMEEGRVSVDGKTYDLPTPFMVIATQNPVMQRGTYYLPESQLDRFMMKLTVGYPEKMDEVQIVKNMIGGICCKCHARGKTTTSGGRTSSQRGWRDAQGVFGKHHARVWFGKYNLYRL